MYSTISLPGFKDAIITQTETRDHQYIIHFEMAIKPHISQPVEKKQKKYMIIV